MTQNSLYFSHQATHCLHRVHLRGPSLSGFPSCLSPPPTLDFLNLSLTTLALNQWFSKCGQTRSSRSEFVRKVNSRVLPRPTKSEPSAWGPANCVLVSPPGDSAIPKNPCSEVYPWASERAWKEPWCPQGLKILALPGLRLKCPTPKAIRHHAIPHCSQTPHAGHHLW